MKELTSEQQKIREWGNKFNRKQLDEGKSAQDLINDLKSHSERK